MKKLKHVGGQGFSCSNENGMFDVITDQIGKVFTTTRTRSFTKLSEAIKYYKRRRTSKAIWDVTSIPELLDCMELT